MISALNVSSKINCPSADPAIRFAEKMRAKGLDDGVMDLFLDYYRELTSGRDFFLTEKEMEPVPETRIASHESLSVFEAHGRTILPLAVRIVLNGGLGTTMGLTGPKSLIAAKNGKTFMDLILEDTRRESATLCLMNSTRTHEATCRHVSGEGMDTKPLMFFQNMFPKILRETLEPAEWPKDRSLEWNPAGHGDIYASLHGSGLLQKLLNCGIRYAFISNSDNLGASLDAGILGYFSRSGLSFLMEVARRTPSDAKGGHLALDVRGNLLLRESAQCRPEDRAAFQDIDRYRFFNTNNIWIDLVHLKRLIQKNGALHLPMMLNPKTLDPRNAESPGVYQIETAMGAAISLFKGAGAVCVPRTRFFPVKSTGDLLVLRSDRYRLPEGEGLSPAPGVENGRIVVKLDPEHYKRLDDFEARFAEGIPSLAACDALEIRGNVFFEKGVIIRGKVTITNPDPEPRTIPAGTVIGSDLYLN